MHQSVRTVIVMDLFKKTQTQNRTTRGSFGTTKQMKDILWYDVSCSLTSCRHLLGESRDGGRCKVVHLHVYDHPTLEWTKPQIRNACFEEPPKFLLQDNGGKFGQLDRPFRVENARKKVRCRSAHDTWLWREMGIRGIPIPYGAPNAAAHMERLIGTLRLSQEYRHVSPSALTVGFEPTSHEHLAFEARVVQSPRTPFLDRDGHLSG